MCIHECRKKAVMFLKSQCGVLKSDFYFKIINNQTLKKKKISCQINYERQSQNGVRLPGKF